MPWYEPPVNEAMSSLGIPFGAPRSVTGQNLQYLKGQDGPVVIEDSQTVQGTLTADDLNVPAGTIQTADIADNAVTAAKLATMPAARVYNSGNLTIGSSNTNWNALTFNSERFDTDSIHDTGSNTGRLTCNTAGIYQISGAIASYATGGDLGVGIMLNGTYYIALHKQPFCTDSQETYLSISTLWQLAAGDYVELMVFQNSGGDVTVYYRSAYSPEFGMVRVG